MNNREFQNRNKNNQLAIAPRPVMVKDPRTKVVKKKRTFKLEKIYWMGEWSGFFALISLFSMLFFKMPLIPCFFCSLTAFSYYIEGKRTNNKEWAMLIWLSNSLIWFVNFLKNDRL